MAWARIDDTHWRYDEDPAGVHYLLHANGVLVEGCYDEWAVLYWPSDPMTDDEPLLEAPPTDPDGQPGKGAWPIDDGVHQLPSPPATIDDWWAALEQVSLLPRKPPPPGWGPL